MCTCPPIVPPCHTLSPGVLHCQLALDQPALFCEQLVATLEAFKAAGQERLRALAPVTVEEVHVEPEEASKATPAGSRIVRKPKGA
jgi:hypothetical protein